MDLSYRSKSFREERYFNQIKGRENGKVVEDLIREPDRRVLSEVELILL